MWPWFVSSHLCVCVDVVTLPPSRQNKEYIFYFKVKKVTLYIKFSFMSSHFSVIYCWKGPTFSESLNLPEAHRNKKHKTNLCHLHLDMLYKKSDVMEIKYWLNIRCGRIFVLITRLLKWMQLLCVVIVVVVVVATTDWQPVQKLASHCYYYRMERETEPVSVNVPVIFWLTGLNHSSYSPSPPKCHSCSLTSNWIDVFNFFHFTFFISWRD